MPKRDMDLVRKVLLFVEDLEAGVYAHLEEDIAGEDFSEDVVSYHITLLTEAGLIEGSEQRGTVRGLTWAGHDFVDSVRDPETWAKVKDGASKAKGWTADLLKDMAKAYVKQKMSEIIGLPI
jgi:DNA-binding transcriptional ArsR family regulator